MFSFAKMSYITPKTRAIDVAKSVDKEVISADFYDINDTQFYVIELPQRIVISFRGTSTLGDAADDARAYLVKLDSLDCKIHKGFNDQFKDAIEPISMHMRRYPPSKEIFFVGHSLGGALATVASVYFVHKFSLQNVFVCTFGSPKVGDSKFAKMFSSSVKSSSRYVNQDDIVTYHPFFFFVHVDGEIKLGKKRSDLRSYYLGRLEDHYLDSYEKNLRIHESL